MANRRGAPQLTDEQMRAKCTCEPTIDLYAPAHHARCPIYSWQRNWGLTPAARQVGARQLGELLDAARRRWTVGARSC